MDMNATGLCFSLQDENSASWECSGKCVAYKRKLSHETASCVLSLIIYECRQREDTRHQLCAVWSQEHNNYGCFYQAETLYIGMAFVVTYQLQSCPALSCPVPGQWALDEHCVILIEQKVWPGFYTVLGESVILFRKSHSLLDLFTYHSLHPEIVTTEQLLNFPCT
jgi:hypothetical protein